MQKRRKLKKVLQNVTYIIYKNKTEEVRNNEIKTKIKGRTEEIKLIKTKRKKSMNAKNNENWDYKVPAFIIRLFAIYFLRSPFPPLRLPDQVISSPPILSRNPRCQDPLLQPDDALLAGQMKIGEVSCLSRP